MQKIRYAVVGRGWRAQFFVRAAKKLPERFELTGVLCRTQEKAEAFAREHGVKAYWNMDDLLADQPDYVVSSVNRAGMPDMAMQLLERGMHVLSETPLADDEETLKKLLDTQRRSGKLLEMAEQYFLYPSHQARRALIEKGLLGDVQSVWMSMMHDYHGISMLRDYLGEETGSVTIAARHICSPIIKTGARGGYLTDGEESEEYRVFAQLDYGDGRMGLYDFACTQYHSAIRSSHLRILGTHGEIFDDEVRWLRAGNRPAKARLVKHADEITGTLRAIDFDGARVYENPFRTDVAMTEDEIAVCHVLVRMAQAVAGGAPHYPYAYRDSYLSMKMRAAAEKNETVTADALAWN